MTNCRSHLKTTHGIVSVAKRTNLQEQAAVTIQSRPTQLDKELVNHALCQFIVRHSLPMSLVESVEFQNFLILLNPDAHNLIIFNRTTFRSYVIHQWQLAQAKIVECIRSSQSKIHLSLDIWTSPNNYLFLGVLAHFVRGNKVQQVLLGLPEVKGHSGADQFSVLRPMLEYYQIKSRIGALTGDNSTTNDSLCREVSNWLANSSVVSKWDPSVHRTRCLGHIINLIVQSFLFFDNSLVLLEETGDNDVKRDESVSDEPKTSTEQQKQRFRSVGMLGKLHNIIVHIRGSAARTKEFEERAGRRIPLDNRTRWNSWYRMLEVSLELEAHVDYYVKNHSELSDDQLDNTDWTVARTMINILRAFYDTTIQNEGHAHNISKMIPSLWPLKYDIAAFRERVCPTRKKKNSSADEKNFSHQIKNCQRVWEKWWEIVWNHPLYLLATILHPAYRAIYIENICRATGELATSVFQKVREFWRQWKSENESDDRTTRIKRQTLNHITQLKKKLPLHS